MHLAGSEKPDSSKRKYSEAAHWAMILGEFAIAYVVFYVSVQQAWQAHIYLRFLMLIPIYHAGAAFGYNGSIIVGMLTVILFVPIFPMSWNSVVYSYDPASPVILIVFFVLFGVVVGGSVGVTRKTSRYVDTLSQVFIGIKGETDCVSVIRRSCEEAAKISEAAGGVVLVRSEGEKDPAKWTLVDVLSGNGTESTATGLSPDNILIRCAETNTVIATNGAWNDERLTMGEQAKNVKSLMAVPVCFDNCIFGAILLMDKKNGENFSARDLSVLKAIAETAGGAIHNIDQEQERQEEQLREEQMRELFSRFVSSSVADYVIENPGLLGGRWQEVTVLVSDIRDFTSISEQVSPRDLVAQLNEYFTVMVDVIFEEQGTIDKFVGDCIIAYWGAPAPDPNHAMHAVSSARKMSKALERLNASWAARNMPLFHTGISIHTCMVLIGNLGDERKKTFTIMGEEVEKAIEMESLTKKIDARIVVSETVANAVGGDGFVEVPEAPSEYGRLFSVNMENS